MRVVVDVHSTARGGEVSSMTTTLKAQTPTTPVTTLEHVDIHRALEIPPVAAAEKPPRRWMNKTVAIGLTAAVLGVGVGYGAAAWAYSGQIDQLENQAQITTSVPFGGFSGEYGAAREHLAQARIANAAMPAFGTSYSAPREHLAQAEIAAAGVPTAYNPLDHPVADILLETQR
jgi:hypothetical protein